MAVDLNRQWIEQKIIRDEAQAKIQEWTDKNEGYTLQSLMKMTNEELLNQSTSLARSLPLWLLETVSEAKKAAGAMTGLTEELEKLYKIEMDSSKAAEKMMAGLNDNDTMRQFQKGLENINKLWDEGKIKNAEQYNLRIQHLGTTLGLAASEYEKYFKTIEKVSKEAGQGSGDPDPVLTAEEKMIQVMEETNKKYYEEQAKMIAVAEVDIENLMISFRNKFNKEYKKLITEGDYAVMLEEATKLVNSLDAKSNKLLEDWRKGVADAEQSYVESGGDPKVFGDYLNSMQQYFSKMNLELRKSVENTSRTLIEGRLQIENDIDYVNRTLEKYPLTVQEYLDILSNWQGVQKSESRWSSILDASGFKAEAEKIDSEIANLRESYKDYEEKIKPLLKRQ
ncbi:MAG: hypothetical protein HUJ63_08680, partial [Enterococcus sp.]|nr:hypothetical protein [Enterococcus sp.]